MTTRFLQDASQISVALKWTNSFSEASGQYLNLNKCELLSIKESATTAICNIPGRNQAIYLGIIIAKDAKLRGSTNFSPVADKTQRKLYSWLQRNVSLKGWILLSKAEDLSRFSYAAQSLYADNYTLNVDTMLSDFVWKRKVHYIEKSVLSNLAESGGMNFIDHNPQHNLKQTG